MSSEPFFEQLKGALTEISGHGRGVETVQECPTAPFMLRTSCYTAFFAVVQHADSVADVFQRAQAEIMQIHSAKGAQWPRDLNLVLLVREDKPTDYATRREIVDNRFLCRKFVLSVNGGNIRDVLAELPFWPPGDLLSVTPFTTAPGVQEAVKGYDRRLIADLASHSPGVVRVFEKIRDGGYDMAAEPSATEVVAPSRGEQSVPTKLEALDIIDFRGIRRLRPDDMPLSGNVIFIYGPNGVGKTSIVDAVEWAISGQVRRLEKDTGRGPDPVVNVLSDKGQAEVTCHLSSRETIHRIKHGRQMVRQIGSRNVSDDRTVIDYVVGTKAPQGEARLRIERLRDLFRGSHLLSQHDIRRFLEVIGPEDRFDILTNMIGAEEFVRFREKVASVLRHLRSQVGTTDEQNKSLKRELQDVAARLRERQHDFEMLSHKVTGNKAPKDLASELLRGLRSYQCAIDEAAIEQAGDEPEEHRFELIAVQAESAIRGKKAAVEDLQVRLKSLEQGLQGYVESRVRCENLAAEIVSTKSVSEKTRADLQRQEKAHQGTKARLQGLKTKQAEVTKRYANLTWLKTILASYRESGETLRRTVDSLTVEREELQRSRTALEDRQKSLNLKRAHLQEIEQAVGTNTNREHALAALLQQIPHVLTRRHDAEQLANKSRLLDSQLVQLKGEVAAARREGKAALARLDELQRDYKSEVGRHDLLSSFLAKLGELVRSNECPLCGRNFASVEDARHSIGEHLSTIPTQLMDLARRLDEAKKDAESKQSQADSIAAAIRATETELQEVNSSRAVATKAVQEFLAACAVLGVTVSEADPASWRNVLDGTRKQCDVVQLEKEVANLRESIKSLAALVLDQQNAVDALRLKLDQDETQQMQLISKIRGYEADMVTRGFELGSLPRDDQLTAELAKKQVETRECDESVAKTEAELKAFESAITTLRESLRIANEDVASKEMQLRQYETTCSRFVAACRAVDVDTENPKESILLVKQSASELNQSLSGLDEKRQILQQLASLGRVKLEIDGLARDEDQLKQQTVARSREESRMRKWTSHVEGLEAEVARRQVDVIATHLQRLEPTIQRLYHRLNPHPVFGNIRIRVNEKTRGLDVEAEPSVARERLGDIAISPKAFFSDAQMNSLAITVFLAGAVRQRWSAFNTILIDDPVQQMDEMNVCAFLDLVRGLSSQQHFIIFTCSHDFYLLAIDKLDCLNKSNKGDFRAYRLEGIAPAELKVHCDVA